MEVGHGQGDRPIRFRRTGWAEGVILYISLTQTDFCVEEVTLFFFSFLFFFGGGGVISVTNTVFF